MSSKKWRELLGCGDSRLGGVRGRSGEEAIRQIGGTGFFRRVFSGACLGDRIVGWQLGDLAGFLGGWGGWGIGRGGKGMEAKGTGVAASFSGPKMSSVPISAPCCRRRRLWKIILTPFPADTFSGLEVSPRRQELAGHDPRQRLVHHLPSPRPEEGVFRPDLEAAGHREGVTVHGRWHENGRDRGRPWQKHCVGASRAARRGMEPNDRFSAVLRPDGNRIG